MVKWAGINLSVIRSDGKPTRIFHGFFREFLSECYQCENQYNVYQLIEFGVKYIYLASILLKFADKFMDYIGYV